MVAVSFFILLMRYAAGWGEVWLQELVMWMHAIVFLGAAAHALAQGKQIRIDIFYREKSAQYRAAVDLFGSLLLLLPMVSAIAIASWPYVMRSWQTLESSGEAGGLWGLFLLKSCILLFCLSLALQGLALALRSSLKLIIKGDSGPLADDRY